LPYRHEIDVLRAVAVLFVLAAHLKLKYMAGGYVGVDIFFVVSGFLIGRQVCVDIEAGQFSFKAFYERRIRRILPGLYAVLAVSAFASLVLLLPADLEDFSASALSTMAFASNLFFWQEAGYFASPAQEKPLLHTWSLGVEEQFYLVFPFAALAVARWANGRWVVSFGVTAAASFAFDIWSTQAHPAAAFYLAPGRAWQFLVGSVLAMTSIPAFGHKAYRAATIGAALVLMFIPLIVYDASTPFPGLAALPPCLGGALFIVGLSHVNYSVFETPPFRFLTFLGRISYSLYLWHWPVIVFYRKWFGLLPDRLNSSEKLALLATMVALAYASFRYIEQPIRKRVIFVTRTHLLAAVSALSVCIAAVAATAILSHGFPGRLDPQVAAMAEYLAYDSGPSYHVGTCFLNPSQTFADLDGKCMLPDPKRRNLLLWGDSTAAQYVHGFETIADDLDLHILQATRSSCPPTFDLDFPDLPNCRAFNDGVRSQIQKTPPDAIVLSSARPFDVVRLRSSVEEIGRLGVAVFVLGPSIRYRGRLPSLLAPFAIKKLKQFNSADYLDKRIFRLDADLKNGIADILGVTFISIMATVCVHDSCPALIDGTTPLQFDDFHLTAPGSEYVVRRLAPLIAAHIPVRRADYANADQNRAP
jgi:peptidoglycan/LPS O-acetylase OafA/YrhL